MIERYWRSLLTSKEAARVLGGIRSSILYMFGAATLIFLNHRFAILNLNSENFAFNDIEISVATVNDIGHDNALIIRKRTVQHLRDSNPMRLVKFLRKDGKTGEIKDRYYRGITIVRFDGDECSGPNQSEDFEAFVDDTFRAKHPEEWEVREDPEENVIILIKISLAWFGAPVSNDYICNEDLCPSESVIMLEPLLPMGPDSMGENDSMDGNSSMDDNYLMEDNHSMEEATEIMETVEDVDTIVTVAPIVTVALDRNSFNELLRLIVHRHVPDCLRVEYTIKATTSPTILSKGKGKSNEVPNSPARGEHPKNGFELRPALSEKDLQLAELKSGQEYLDSQEEGSSSKTEPNTVTDPEVRPELDDEEKEKL
jgi:hypothetical protein